MAESFRIRAAVQADGGFLGDMVVEAANWRGGGARPRHEVISSAEHSRYLTAMMAEQGPPDGPASSMQVCHGSSD